MDCLAANGVALLTCEDAVAILDEHQHWASLAVVAVAAISACKCPNFACLCLQEVAHPTCAKN